MTRLTYRLANEAGDFHDKFVEFLAGLSINRKSCRACLAAENRNSVSCAPAIQFMSRSRKENPRTCRFPVWAFCAFPQIGSGMGSPNGRIMQR